MARLTDRGHRDECVDPAFPVVDKIRIGRLKWLRHVLRSDQSNLVRQAVVVVVEDCLAGRRSPEGTVIMDAPNTHNIGGTSGDSKEQVYMGFTCKRDLSKDTKG